MSTNSATATVAEIKRRVEACGNEVRAFLRMHRRRGSFALAERWSEYSICSFRNNAGVITHEGAEWDNRRRGR